jgi:hypothetical protein
MVVLDSSSRGALVLVEALAPKVAGAVQDAHDEGLGGSNPKVDIVSTVHGQAQTEPDLVPRNAAVTQQSDPFQV